MASYVLKRLGWTIVILWVVLTVTFAAVFLSPIDPAHQYAGARAPKQVVEEVREQLGLNDSLFVQYGRYVGRLVKGDFGASFFTHKPVLQSVLDRLPATGALAGGAAVVALAIGIPLGTFAALRWRSKTDKAILLGSLLGIATPSFVLGFILLYFLAFKYGWFPLGGSGSILHLVLPAITVGLPSAAWYARMLRSTVLDIGSEEFIRNARAKGLPERLIVGRHILRNAMAPIITMVGLDLGAFLGGLLVIEQVFGWPGLGQQVWRAVQANDIPLVMGTVLVTTFLVVIFNLLADLANATLDPRARYS